jgi:hypothetical protein
MPALASSAWTHLTYAFNFGTLNLNHNTMVYNEVYCGLLFIQYIRVVTTQLRYSLPPAVVYYCVVHGALSIVESCTAVFVHRVKKLSITAVWGPMDWGFTSDWGLSRASQSATDRRTLAAAVLFC